MTDAPTPPPLSDDELAALDKLCEAGLTTISDATLVLIAVPRLLAEVRQAREA